MTRTEACTRRPRAAAAPRPALAAVLLAFAATAAGLQGCAGTGLYHWGSYEEQIYAAYAQPVTQPAQERITELEADYQKARAAGKPVPPGYHAYLGTLYFQLSKTDQALEQFKTEKALFPESSVYMGRLLARLTQPAPSATKPGT